MAIISKLQPILTQHMKNFRINSILIGTLLVLFLAGCANDSALSEADIQATVNAAVQATTVALAPPTFTPIPTLTPVTEAGETAAGGETETNSADAEPTATPSPTNTPEPTLTPTPDVPFVRTDLGDGSTRYDMPLDGFGVSLPNDWIVADIYQVTDSADQRQLEELMGSGIFRNLVQAGVKFYALNTSSASLDSISPININISSIPTEASTLEAAVEEWVNQVTYQLELFPEELIQTPSSLGQAPTVRLDYTFQQANPLDRDVSLQFVQHVVQSGDELLLISITSPVEIAGDFIPAAEAALQSIEFYAP